MKYAAFVALLALAGCGMGPHYREADRCDNPITEIQKWDCDLIPTPKPFKPPVFKTQADRDFYLQMLLTPAPVIPYQQMIPMPRPVSSGFTCQALGNGLTTCMGI